MVRSMKETIYTPPPPPTAALGENRHPKKDVSEEGRLGRVVVRNIKGSMKPLKMGNKHSSKGTKHRESDVYTGVTSNNHLSQKL